jgi:hypothetical protein
VAGDVTKWYQRRNMFPLWHFLTYWVVGDVTKWYQIHGFDIEPGWAMLVVNEAKILEPPRVSREHLGRVWKLRRYISSRNIIEKRDNNNHGFGTTRFEVGP